MARSSLPPLLPKSLPTDPRDSAPIHQFPFYMSELPMLCGVCGCILDGPCVKHGKCAPDSTPLPLAVCSVPEDLYIGRASVASESRVKGIFAKHRIEKLTIFGPLVCPFSPDMRCPSGTFSLPSPVGWRNCKLESDELCNWMKYVRPAQYKNEQNLMAFQQLDHIYFCALIDIEPDQELKFWYSKRFGASLGKPELTPFIEGVSNFKRPIKFRSTLQALSPKNDKPTSSSLNSSQTKGSRKTFAAQAPIGIGENHDYFRLSMAPQQHDSGRNDLSTSLDLQESSSPQKKRRIVKAIPAVREYKQQPVTEYSLLPSSSTCADFDDLPTSPAPSDYNNDLSFPRDFDQDDSSAAFPCDVEQDDPSVQYAGNSEGDPDQSGLDDENGGSDDKDAEEEHNNEICYEPSSSNITAKRKDRSKKASKTATIATRKRTKPSAETAEDSSAPGENEEEKKRNRVEIRRTKLYHRALPDEAKGNFYRFRCDTCSSRFRSQELLDLHAVSHGSPFPAAQSSLSCPACGALTKDREELLAHAEQHRQQKCIYRKVTDFRCEDCGRFFKSQEYLEVHRKRYHSGEVEKTHECDICHEKFFTLAGVVSHKKSHDVTNGFFKCHVCLMNFRSATALKEHTLVHCENGVYPCRVCGDGKTFPTFQKLRVHFRSHHSGRSETCEICGFAPRPGKSLTMHMKIHMDKFDFKCGICERQFKRRKNYQDHLKRFHDPSNPKMPKSKLEPDGVAKPRRAEDYMAYTYRCLDCKLGFLRQKQLVRHMEGRHPDRSLLSVPELNLPTVKATKYECSFCKKMFVSSERRTAHLETDHADAMAAAEAGTTPLPPQRDVSYFAFLCTHCDTHYNSASLLLRHVKNQHPEAQDEP